MKNEKIRGFKPSHWNKLTPVDKLAFAEKIDVAGVVVDYNNEFVTVGFYDGEMLRYKTKESLNHLIGSESKKVTSELLEIAPTISRRDYLAGQMVCGILSDESIDVDSAIDSTVMSVDKLIQKLDENEK